MESWYLPKCRIKIPEDLDPDDHWSHDAEQLRSLGDKLCDIHHIDYKSGIAYLTQGNPILHEPDGQTRFMAKLEWVYFQEEDEHGNTKSN